MNATALAIVLLLSAAKADSDQAKQDEVLAAIRARLAAVAQNDTAAWSRWVADDMITPLEGATPSKAAWMKAHAAWPREVSYWYGPLQDTKVRMHGDTAVVVYHAQQFTKVGGQTTSVNKWQIETHERRGGRWQLVGVADATIPPEPVAVKLDATTLDAYVGDYEWAPTMISKVRRSGDALSEEIAGQGTTSYSAENETTFFVPGAAAGGDTTRVIFVKNAEGRVTHYIYRDYGATDRIVRKIR
jgi:ketosteroid isomerase-like protein